MVIYYIGHVYLMPYVYSFSQIFQALRLLAALRLFQTLEYTVRAISAQISQEGIKFSNAKEHLRFYCHVYIL